jgi:hypothetical protein
MKVIRIFLLFFAFIVISCKKDYTCVCTNSNGFYTAGTVDATKSNAKKYCKDLSAGKTTCKLKD